jgi:regulator of protease activity HflC (stomatin/prohibitin superfamily)
VKFWQKPRTWIIVGASVVGVFLLYQLWVWEVERTEVPPGKFLVKINMWGNDLPEGEIVAPDDSYKGIQKDVLPEGRHFLNPLLYRYQTHDMLEVPIGKCAILTHKAGDEIAKDRRKRGEFLVEEDEEGEISERGIVRKVLLPGKYRINPHVYSLELVDAVEIKASQVGVRTLRWGKDPRTLKQRESVYTVPEDYRGVQEKPVPPGTYYINPYVESIVPVDIDMHQVEFDDIYFPSLDGFNIQPHVRVSYKVMPDRAPELFVMLCDNGQLPQADGTAEEKKKNPILQKFVLPLIRGWVRIEGSKYGARDYVSQQKGPDTINPREQLRKVLEEKVKPVCREVGVIITSITVAELGMNDDLKKLADQIFERERTRATRDKNAQLVEQYKSQQEQKGKEALSEQRSKLVDANRDLKVAKTLAKQQKEVEKARLENDLKAAETRMEAAREQAKAIVTRGKAEAAIVNAQNEAEVSGLRTAIAGFPSADQFAQYHVMTKMSPALSEIFASDTSEFAKLFALYMTPKKNGTPPRKIRSEAEDKGER